MGKEDNKLFQKLVASRPSFDEFLRLGSCWSSAALTTEELDELRVSVGGGQVSAHPAHPILTPCQSLPSTTSRRQVAA